MIGETNRRVIEKIKDYNIRDKKSHLLKHAGEKGHTHDWESYFKILGNKYQSSFNRKIKEFLFMRQLQPTLNVNGNSIPLLLFNWFFIAIILRDTSINCSNSLLNTLQLQH